MLMPGRLECRPGGADLAGQSASDGIAPCFSGIARRGGRTLFSAATPPLQRDIYLHHQLKLVRPIALLDDSGAEGEIWHPTPARQLLAVPGLLDPSGEFGQLRAAAGYTRLELSERGQRLRQ